jgi:trans-aconitate 2-methyltransferase
MTAHAAGDSWDPAVYDRFKTERMQPALDLIDLVQPIPGGRAIDLGCGSGEITELLHERSRAAQTLGIDSSEAMLASAGERARDGLQFELGDIADDSHLPAGSLDLVFANASLQWLPDHAVLFARLHGALRGGGQLAVQMPANFDHPTHTIADSVGQQLGVEPLHRFEAVLRPEEYSRLLHDLGFADQHVRLQVYLHPLPRTSAVIDWVQGSLLTYYRRVLGERFDEFLVAYRETLLRALGDPEGELPYAFAFKRLLMTARR